MWPEVDAASELQRSSGVNLPTTNHATGFRCYQNHRYLKVTKINVLHLMRMRTPSKITNPRNNLFSHQLIRLNFQSSPSLAVVTSTPPSSQPQSSSTGAVVVLVDPVIESREDL